MNAIIVLLKLICAHICSDFVFQTDGIAKNKKQKGMSGLKYLAIHSLIHALTAYVLVAIWSDWIIPVVIFVSHLFIDIAKSRCKKDSVLVFIIDQLLHIAVICVLWLLLFGDGISLTQIFSSFDNTKTWILLIGYILMLKPSSVILSLFLKQWTPTGDNSQSLPNAGQWIGYLERILILTFILIQSIEGVGFLLAAKSVFRFGELNKPKDIKTTEYVLIGTLSSFAIAVLIGYAVKSIL